MDTMDEEPMMLEEHISKNKRLTIVLCIVMFAIFGSLIFFISLLLIPGAPYVGVILGIIVGAVYIAATYSFSVKSVISAAKARPADPRKRKEKLLIYKVEEMAIAAGLPVPYVYVQDSKDINAFATGRNPDEAVICCTTGALEKLETSELEGVMAHEMSHIQNYDIRVMTITVGVVGAIALIAEIMFWMFIFGGGRRGGRSGEANIILIVIAVLLIILAPLFSRMAYLAISRRREYLADASGAYLTRNPEGLASALERIKGNIPEDPKGSKTVAPLYIANPFKRALRDSMWSTHPPIDERIKRLRSM